MSQFAILFTFLAVFTSACIAIAFDALRDRKMESESQMEKISKESPKSVQLQRNGFREHGKKDCLILCHFFFPDHVTSAVLLFDLAKYLTSSGFSIGALSGYPKEYADGKRVPKSETTKGVEIRRIRFFQTNRSSRIGRLVNYFTLIAGMFCHLPYLKRYRCAIVTSDPPILPILPILAKRFFGTKVIFLSYDVYPEIAYSSGHLKPKSLICGVMNWINRQVSRNADAVIALTDEMRNFLLRNRPGLSENRVVTIANWAHEGVSLPDSEAYERFGYQEGQFIVSYFGNMGVVQEMETMIRAAGLLKDDQRIRFLIAGHGSKKNAVKERIERENLTNVQLTEFLTGEDFQKAVAISSCYVVSLEPGACGLCAPSKYYSYLQGGRPVLAVMERDSYLSKEVRERNIGFHAEIGDARKLRDAIVFLLERPEEREAMGRRARELYLSQYAPEIAFKRYRQVLESLLGKDGSSEESEAHESPIH